MKNSVPLVEKRKHLPKGYLSMNGEPTSNSVNMYFIYLWFLPKDWNKTVVHKPSVDKVREYFGVNYGFENMIRWGILHGTCNSRTSSGRHVSMSKAHVIAQTMIGAGIKLSNIKLSGI